MEGFLAAHASLGLCAYCQQYAVEVYSDILRSKPQDSDALLTEPNCSAPIILDPVGVVMTRTIDLHSELRFGAIEVENVSPDRMLAAKFEVGEATAA